MKKNLALFFAVCTAVSGLFAAGDAVPAKVENAVPPANKVLSKYITLGEPSYAPAAKYEEEREPFGDDIFRHVTAPKDRPCGYASRQVFPVTKDATIKLEIELRGSGNVEIAVFFCDANGAIIGKQGESFEIPGVNMLFYRKFKCKFTLNPPANCQGLRFGWSLSPNSKVTVKEFEGEYDD